MRVTTKQLAGLAGAAVGTAVLIGCQQVPVNSSASAISPAITWTVTEVGGSVVNFAGSSGLQDVKPGRVYDVSAHAQTPSGAKSLTVTGSGGWSCAAGNIGSQTTADLASSSAQQQPQNGRAWDTVSTFETIGIPDANALCHSGLRFVSGSFGLNATATNFAGMTRTGHLTLLITP
jgi:hypothetical protein